MAQRLVIITVLFTFVLMALQVAGYFFPSALTWGFHFFAFLPTPALIVYIIITLCALILLIRIDFDPLISRYSEILNKKSFHFLAIISLIIIAISILFRVKIPLLGNSFFLVKNYFESKDFPLLRFSPFTCPRQGKILYCRPVIFKEQL